MLPRNHLPPLIAYLDLTEYHGAEAVAALSVLTSFQSFEFVFMAHLMQEIFGYTDELSRALQRKVHWIYFSMNMQCLEPGAATASDHSHALDPSDRTKPNSMWYLLARIIVS